MSSADLLQNCFKTARLTLCLLGTLAAVSFGTDSRNKSTSAPGGFSMTDPKVTRQLPLPAQLLAEGSSVITATTIAFTEGPAVDRDGSVYFSDIPNNRIMKLSAEGQLSVFRADSGRTNGNLFDQQGRLVSCEGSEMGPGGRRRIVRGDLKTGQITVLTERYQGARYNSPNDLAIDSRGRIYFTDPCYGDRSSMEMEIEGVYRIDPDSSVTRILAQPAIQRPNGIAISPDDKTLYLVDSNPDPGGNRTIWAFDLQPDGSVSNQRLVYDFAPGRGGDGMRLDVQGNLWIAGGVNWARREGETTLNPTGIYVITSAGKLAGHIPVPEDRISNLAFGGPEKKTLYITAGKSLFKIQTKVSGWSVYPLLHP
jgi:gluconolactonase